MRKLLSAALVLPFLALALPAAADSEAEALYSRYHEAIEVAKLCRNITFDQGDIDRMAAVIHDRIGHDIGAKRLSLLTKGQRDGDEVVKKHGCESDEAKDLLGLYDADLAPVVD